MEQSTIAMLYLEFLLEISLFSNFCPEIHRYVVLLKLVLISVICKKYLRKLE